MNNTAAHDPDISVTVAIATLGVRLNQIVLPDPHPGIDYLITVQKPLHGARSDWVDRPDVRIETSQTIGLSENRNLALAQAMGAFLLFSDDDITLAVSEVLALRDILSERPDLALIAGWRRGRRPVTGSRSARYALKIMNSGRICAPEFMIRLGPIRDRGLRFDPRFGVGGAFPIGEDYIFVTDVLKAGLNGLSVPIEIGQHPGISSGDNWQDPAIMQARRHMLRRVFGAAVLPVRIAYTWRHRQRFSSALSALRFAVGWTP